MAAVTPAWSAGYPGKIRACLLDRRPRFLACLSCHGIRNFPHILPGLLRAMSDLRSRHVVRVAASFGPVAGLVLGPAIAGRAIAFRAGPLVADLMSHLGAGAWRE